MKADGRLDKIAWLRIEDKINKLQADLRHIRLSFGTIPWLVFFVSNESLGFQSVKVDCPSNRKTITMLETRFESLQFVAEKNKQSTEILVQQTESFQNALMHMLNVSKQNEERLGAIERHLVPHKLSEAEKLHHSGRGAPEYSADPTYSRHKSLSALRMRFLQRRKCTPYCDCACHTTTRFNTPRVLQFLTGTFFVGYTTVPKLTKPCTNEECEKSLEGFVAVNCYFPRWAMSRVLAACVRFTDYKGPEVSIRLPLCAIQVISCSRLLQGTMW
jgi:hypothetical protein